MGVDCRSIDRAVCVETGSATIEGIAAIAIVFVLFTMLSQLAVALLAHQVAESVVASAARAASLDIGSSSAVLVADLEATVPGARRVEAGIDPRGSLVRAWARFEFVPPGPLFRTLWFSVEVEVPVVVAP